MDRDTKIRIANNMIRYGGGFASKLGEALLVADSDNERKIINTWLEMINKYASFDPELPEIPDPSNYESGNDLIP